MENSTYCMGNLQKCVPSLVVNLLNSINLQWNWDFYLNKCFFECEEPQCLHEDFAWIDKTKLGTYQYNHFKRVAAGKWRKTISPRLLTGIWKWWKQALAELPEECKIMIYVYMLCILLSGLHRCILKAWKYFLWLSVAFVRVRGRSSYCFYLGSMLGKGIDFTANGVYCEVTISMIIE